MPREKRAAQFAPFDALRGLREALALVDYQHESVLKGDVDEETAARISDVMTELEKNDVVEVRYFEDGHEKTYTGLVEVDVYQQTVRLKGEKKTIGFSSLLDMRIQG